VVLTQDWHPSGHSSFATSHPGTKPFDSIKLPYGEQVLWPDHCVQGSDGAGLHKDLAVPHAQLVVRKGWRKEVDSYSAFVEADSQEPYRAGGLSRRARSRARVRVRARDRLLRGSGRRSTRASSDSNCAVIEDACRAIDMQGSLAAAWERMKKAGVARIHPAISHEERLWRSME